MTLADVYEKPDSSKRGPNGMPTCAIWMIKPGSEQKKNRNNIWKEKKWFSASGKIIVYPYKKPAVSSKCLSNVDFIDA